MEAWQIISLIGTGIYRRRKLMAVLIFTLSFLVLGTIGYFGYGRAPRHRTAATIVLEGRADQIPLFEEWTPKRPIQIQLAINTSASQNYDLPEGLLFPAGLFVDIISGTIVGSVDLV